ncbi:MAG: hypothetical protein AAFW73_23530 [Bacteroidota bacterium]
MSDTKRLLGPLEWLILVVGLGILLYLLFQKQGFQFFERSERVEFIDPRDVHQARPPQRGPTEAQVEVDRLLRQLATDFQNGTDDPSSPAELGRQWGLSAEEIRFYRRIRDSYRPDASLDSANDWLRALRGARRTYLQLQNLLDELSPRQERGSTPDQILENEVAARDFYDRLADWYDLSVEEIEDFARRGGRELEDWALFLDRHAR